MDPQTQPEQPIVNPVTPRKNYLLLGALVIIAALLGSGATYLTLNAQKTNQPEPSPVVQSQPTPTPTPDITASWKTYTDDTYTFQIKYPTNWYTGKQYSSIYINDKPIPTIPLTHGIPSAFSIQVTLISNSEEFNPTWKNQRSQVIIDNVQGTKFVDLESSPALELLETRIIFDRSPYRYTILFPNQNEIGNHNEIFDQMLSTFKFTDATTSTEGKFCGGIAAVECPVGYTCKMDGNYPDAGGECVKE